MKKEKIVCLHRYYSALVGISIIFAGICLIAGCLTIYYTGEGTYSREIVVETFSKISIPIYICLVLTIIGFICDFLFSTTPKKEKTKLPYVQIVERMISKRDLNSCNETISTAIFNERKKRKLRSIIQIVLLCIGSAVFLAHSLNGNNFHQSQINESMIQAMQLLIPCIVVPFAYAIFVVYSNDKSFQREIDLLKQIPTIESKNAPAEPKSTSFNFTLLARIALLLVGITILGYGFVSGGTLDVLTKAINICTECIGLG